MTDSHSPKWSAKEKYPVGWAGCVKLWPQSSSCFEAVSFLGTWDSVAFPSPRRSSDHVVIERVMYLDTLAVAEMSHHG